MNAAPNQGRLRPDRGFTVAELIVALSLMFVGLMGMMSLQIVSQRASQQSRAMTEAVALAQDRLERVRRLPIAQVVSQTELKVDAHGVSGTGPFTRTTTVATVGGQLSVRVDVAWRDAGEKPHTVTLRTVRAQ